MENEELEVQNLTRKERRELKRQENKDNEEKSERSKTSKRVAFWAVGLGLLALVGYGVFKAGNNTGSTNGGASLISAVTDQDLSEGDPNAPITLVEYSDFQCPACGAYYPILKQLTSEFGDKIRFVYRNFPLRTIHKNADLAARAAEAANLQGKFWQMHDTLFERQNAWANSADVVDIFTSYAEELGLDVEKFKSDINSSEIKSKVDTSYDSANSAGINATPTFYLNGEKITQNPEGYEPFKQLIIKALQAKQDQ